MTMTREAIISPNGVCRHTLRRTFNSNLGQASRVNFSCRIPLPHRRVLPEFQVLIPVLTKTDRPLKRCSSQGPSEAEQNSLLDMAPRQLFALHWTMR